MARQCYLILDRLHIMEPDDLSARYLDEPYRSTNPPRFLGAQAGGSAPSGLDDRAVPEPAVIGRASSRQILWDNCARLYAIETPPTAD